MKYLSLLVFTAGAVTLGMELSAARLLEPTFGNNQIVWATLIGLILLYLAIGSWLGGQLADRFPQRSTLDFIVTAAAIGVAIIPLLSTPVLAMAARGLDNFQTELLAGSLLAVLILFSIPGILLGMVSPWAVRLSVNDLDQTGQTAGRLYAIATAGSLVGTFVPVLWFIPTYGTRLTFFLLALILLSVITLGSLRHRHRWVPLTGLIAVLLLTVWITPNSGIRSTWDNGADGPIVYEDESLYNYIAVRQWGSEHHLKLNDGIGIHSVHHPDSVMSQGIWDYFLLAPFFNPPPVVADDVDNLLLIGLAAGTVSELYTNVYGPIPITGIELDPQIIEVGQRYFGMDQPNLTAIAADGRRWLFSQPADARWDVVAIDAYRPPYIPFHLSSVEFFQLVHDHLSEDGMVAINVGRTAYNFALVDALAATLGEVFPNVYIIDEPGPVNDLGSSLLVATAQPTQLEHYLENIAALSDTLPIEFREFASRTTIAARIATPSLDTPIFTDDHAPIERVVHGIVWDFVAGDMGGP